MLASRFAGCCGACCGSYHEAGESPGVHPTLKGAEQRARRLAEHARCTRRRVNPRSLNTYSCMSIRGAAFPASRTSASGTVLIVEGTCAAYDPY